MSSRSSFNPRKLQRLAVSLLLCVFLAAAFTALAQSGRRIPKQPTSPDPKPPAQTEPSIQPSTPAAPQLPILVVKNLPTAASSSILANIALNGCIEELKQSPAVQVSTGKDKNRKDASDYAKASTDTYVVLIQLESDVVDRGSLIEADPRSLSLTYIVFAPGTGKIKTQGRVFQGQSRGPLGVPVPNSTSSYDYEFRRCGREAAGRVLDALNLARPQPR
ncbi:MAG TPA: hypothetical protein VLU47_16445 [Blastocatellia bacterium]|nr:hypothetical protein [Blastocatellia bacterium]